MNPFKSTLIKISIVVGMINLQSCIPILLLNYDSNPIVEHDEVKGVTRFKKTLFYYFSEERNSSFIKNEQQIFKEISPFQDQYNVYDYLHLDDRLNHIENTIYFIIDQQIYPIEINFQSTKNLSEIAKDEEDILLADSTKMSVITDYEIKNYAVISIHYQLEKEIITKISYAKDVKIRYYTPPEMITLKLSNHKIKTFKALAESVVSHKN
ncbi:hypothetical protein JKA74_10585 [Marivirga sp. S37H4]|uniref:Uncharacterized protein n=1 Tax=Marivirga aurantiaca TaxID=2802615 RepID=A0A934WYG5_9BACT|nr:hypothetical protein [Marivirga aurantiaca]MBK6265484.1 hypothetical protein [Marivirga aurantiaca]